jgi:hypothetical protein
VQQLDAVTAAASSTLQAPGSSRLAGVLPKGVKTLQQLLEQLQQLTLVWWDAPEFKAAKLLALAAVQLVADAARSVARQQVIERNTPAYNTLLTQGYRAGARGGVQWRFCCW